MSNELAAFGSVPFAPAITKKPKQDLDRGYAPNLQLVATGNSKVVMEDKAKSGEFIIRDGQDVERLGKEVTVVLLGKLFKAVDFGGDETVVNYDPESDVYQDIASRQLKDGINSKCMFGPLYLAYCVNTESFVELYLNSKSGKREESNLDNFVPVGPEQAKELGIEPRGPSLATLKSRFVDGKNHKWFVFDTKAGPETLDGVEPPSPELVEKACVNFYKQAKEEEVEEEDRAR
jgi:hypothetical protein